MATARPMPLSPPVMIATLSCNFPLPRCFSSSARVRGFEKAFCGARRGPWRDHVSPDVLFVLCRALEAATLLQPAAPWRDQSRWPAPAIGRHVRLPECVPFLRAQTHPPECWAICPHARPPALVRLFLLLAYQKCFASSDAFGRRKIA